MNLLAFTCVRLLAVAGLQSFACIRLLARVCLRLLRYMRFFIVLIYIRLFAFTCLQ